MRRFVFERDKLGTLFRIVAVASRENGLADLAEEAFLEVDRIENAYSRFLHGNQLSGLNDSLGKWVKIDEEFYKLIEFGESLKVQTLGAFNLTVKSLLDASGYDENYSFVERAGGNLGKVEFKSGNLVRISAPIDLGALGKGYAVDRVAEILNGLENFCINAGGDIYVKGSDIDEGQSGWKILFEDPSDLSQAIGFVVAGDLAFASSSPSRRKWADKSHLIDARKLKSANAMMAVYTQTKNCLLADAYATALFVSGFEDAKKIVEKVPVEAMFISQKGEIYKTDGFSGGLFTL